MESIRQILEESGAEVMDTSGRKIQLESIQHKIDTNNKFAAVQQELLDLDEEEKTEWVNYHKLIGNKYYRCKNFPKAADIYLEALTAAKIIKDDVTTLTMLCNLASCMISQEYYYSAVHLLDEALKMNPGHARALERRAVAYSSMGKIEEAEKDIKAGLACVQDSKLKSKFNELLSIMIRDKQKKREMYKKMVEVKVKPKDVYIPDWVKKVVFIGVKPVSWVGGFLSFCKRKKA